MMDGTYVPILHLKGYYCCYYYYYYYYFQFCDVASLASILIRILALNCDRFLEEPANKQWKD
jgi:hypothetical protein